MNQRLLTVLRNTCRAAPTAALASGIVSPVALAAPGDLDPGFADVGRFVLPDFLGPALAVAAQDDGIILAGGEVVPDFNSSADDQAHGFANRVSSTGTLDASFAAPGLDGIMVVDAEVQADGKIVGVGNRSSDSGIKQVAFRLERDGSLDTEFGSDGIVELTVVNNVRSVAVDPGGTIVIGGTLSGENPRGDLEVLRLLSTGEPDESFGTAGVFSVSADIEQTLSPARILSAVNGGYRIALNDATALRTCHVLALTASGSVDDTFGDGGYGGLGTPSKYISCYSMAELPDGRLLVAGVEASDLRALAATARPLVVRLLASGAVDPGFTAELLADTTLNTATEIAVDPNNASTVVVFDETLTGVGEPGLVVARLQTDGTLDQLFGDGGATWVDLPGVDGNTAFASPGDVTVLQNGDVLVAGGASRGDSGSFVVRLLGGSGSDGPGVLGVRNIHVQTAEAAQQAVVAVRRMGGRAGSVSVAYEAHASSSEFVDHATEGGDFTVVSGRLEWADGDASEKQVVVPIAPDDGSPEEAEEFVVQLSDVQGGVGLGALKTTVLIASDAPAAGMFSIESPEFHVAETDTVAQVYISRDYYYEGAVSVTVTMSSGSATSGEDFATEPLTVSWGDGDFSRKLVQIPITDDSSDEPEEQFSLQLADATGGAIIGPKATATVFIADDDAPPPPPPPPPPDEGGGGGGGRIGFVSLLLLGLARLLRARPHNAVRAAAGRCPALTTHAAAHRRTHR